jgi:hypothetical protein
MEGTINIILNIFMVVFSILFIKGVQETFQQIHDKKRIHK